jgi:hypothetical protein
VAGNLGLIGGAARGLCPRADGPGCSERRAFVRLDLGEGAGLGSRPRAGVDAYQVLLSERVALCPPTLDSRVGNRLRVRPFVDHLAGRVVTHADAPRRHRPGLLVRSCFEIMKMKSLDQAVVHDRRLVCAT